MAIIVPIVSAWNPAGLNKALADIRKAEGSFNKFVVGTAGIGKTMSNVGKSLSMNVTLPLTLVGAASIKTAADFEVAMAQVAVATNTPVSGLKNLSDLAKQLGADTIFSANEAAQAMLELSKAGITPAEISSGALKNTLDLAAASGMELADSAVVMSAGMNTFNLGAKDSVSIVDALAGAANASAADVSDIALALQQVGQQAVASGLTIQETTAALAAFADAGVRGSDAGTSFKTFLQRLNPVSAEASKIMKQLGIEFFDSSGNMKDLTQIAGEVQDGFKGLTQEQRLAAMQTIFGSDALRAANILYNEGSTGIAKYISASSLAGAAADMAAARNSGLSGSLEKLKGSMETAALVIGEQLAPTIMRVAEALQNFFNGFAKLNPVTQKAIIFFAGLIAVVGPLLFIFGAFLGALSNIAKVMGTVNLLMGTNIGLFKGTAFAAGEATVATTIFGRALRIAIAGTGIGLLIIGIAELIILMTGLGDATTVTANKSVEAGARMRNSFAGVQDEIDATRKKNALLQKELAGEKQESRDSARSAGRNNAPARVTSVSDQIKNLNLEFEGLGGSSAKATTAVKELSKETQAAMALLGNELKSRTDQLDAIKEKFKNIKNAVKDAITGVINFGAAQGDSITKNKSFIQVLQDQAALATQFADKVKTLISLGLSESAIGQVLAAGADAGTAIADEIIAGGATVVDQVNTLVQATASIAEQLGEAAGKQFYQTGIDAGQALVDGVKAAIAAAGFSIGLDGNIMAPTQDTGTAADPSKTTKSSAKKPAAAKPTFKAPAKTPINQALLEKLKKIPMMAAGGIVTSPTLAMIGEAGPEAVIPLTGNNMSMGVVYNINVNAGMGTNGAQVGREIVDAIKKFEKSSGPVFASA